MSKTLVELGGFFLVIVGLFGLVAAAAIVSVALAVATAGLIFVFIGIAVVYVANALAANEPKGRA